MPSGFLGRGIGPSPIARKAAASADWWAVAGQTCVAAYQPIGAADLAMSYVNLANPGVNNAAPGVAPTLGAAGWSFDGTQWLETGIVPASGWSAIVKFSNGASATSLLFGMTEGVGRAFYIAPWTTVGATYYNGAGASELPDTTAGILAITPGKGYRDGIEDAVVSGWSSTATRTIVIGAGRGATIADYFTGIISAVAIYSSALSAADVAALTTRIQGLA